MDKIKFGHHRDEQARFGMGHVSWSLSEGPTEEKGTHVQLVIMCLTMACSIVQPPMVCLPIVWPPTGCPTMVRAPKICLAMVWPPMGCPTTVAARVQVVGLELLRWRSSTS